MARKNGFEIGRVISNSKYSKEKETRLVDCFATLSEAVDSWRESKYREEKGYFIDYWEQGNSEEWFPIAQIPMDKICIKTIDAENIKPPESEKVRAEILNEG